MKTIKEFMKTVNNKLRSNSGESISETLVALLISALALVMLAGAISAASRIVTSSRNKLSTYYDNNEILATMPAGEGQAGRLYFSNQEGDFEPIRYYENNTFSKNKVIAYRQTN